MPRAGFGLSGAYRRGLRFLEGRAGQRVPGMGEGGAGPASEAGRGGAGTDAIRGLLEANLSSRAV